MGWTSEDAVKHYLARISARIPQFHTMEEKDLNYIKVQHCLFKIVRDLTNLWIDDKCGGETDCQQQKFWLPVKSDSVLSSQSSYQDETHILCSGG